MQNWFDSYDGLIDWGHLARTVCVLVIGAGRVGLAFALKAAQHAVRCVRVVDADWTERRNVPAGYGESQVGQYKVDGLVQLLHAYSRRIAVQGAALRLTPDDPLPGPLETWLVQSSVVALCIDDFATASALARAVYPHRPCVFATVMDRGQTGLAAFSVPGQTPCLECTARLSRRHGAEHGQCLSVHVDGVVNVMFSQFLGLVLNGRTGFDMFRWFVQPRSTLATVVNTRGGFKDIVPGRPDIPAGVHLVETVSEDGRGPSCRVCRGYRP